MNGKDDFVYKQEKNSPNATITGCPPELSLAEENKEKNRWYVMRSTYSREMKAKSLLESEGVKCYIPMKKVRCEQGDEVSPAIHNLVFVYTNRGFMDTWKRQHEQDCPLRYAMDRASSAPMIVRNKEMEDFIRVTKDVDDGFIYLDNPNVVVEKGKPVEIVCGEYAGVRGTILRILRDRKVVVSLNGIVAVAISGIPFAWMKEI